MSAPGILKAEMRKLNSLIIRMADKARVPAGSALAVDRDQFALGVTQALESHPNVQNSKGRNHRNPKRCVQHYRNRPLTSTNLSESIGKLTQSKNLYFFDAIAPIIDTDSINMDKVFRASRYDKGTADYLNCPMDKETYDRFYDALIQADRVQSKEF